MMRKLTKDVLLELGFDEVQVTAEESGDEEFVYYSMDIDGNSYVSLISDESEGDGFEHTVELFEFGGYGKCKTDDDVTELLRILKKYQYE